MAMSKGIQMMLQALGITIDPGEIEEIFRKLQKDLPAAAAYITAQFDSIAAQLHEIDSKLRDVEQILTEYNSGRMIPVETVASVLEPNGKTKGVRVNGKSTAE